MLSSLQLAEVAAALALFAAVCVATHRVTAIAEAGRSNATAVRGLRVATLLSAALLGALVLVG